MNHSETMMGLFYLIATADGEMSPKEIEFGSAILSKLGMSHEAFQQYLNEYKGKDKEILYNSCLMSLKQMAPKDQINSIAWLCIISNSDGFMDKLEWTLIYKIFHKELNLKMNDIMAKQKELFPYVLQVKAAL